MEKIIDKDKEIVYEGGEYLICEKKTRIEEKDFHADNIRWKVICEKKSLTVVSYYEREYLPGTIVSARKGSLGLFCFETKQYAEKFIEEWRNRERDPIEQELVKQTIIPEIIKVETMNETFPNRVCSLTADYVLDKFNELGEEWNRNLTAQVPPGTVCCEHLRVL